ncbi:MAG: hypothetical protein H7Y09_08530 [Chitinophagaceae bacterium]|nr:hypothetical protein [Anaerolineae bacterium]
METIDLRDLYSGGYFLLRAGRPDWPPPFGEFLPNGNLISLSNCICRKRLSVIWGCDPGNRKAALEFGIPETRLTEFVAWCGTEYRESMDLTSMFYSSDAARNFIRRFELNTDNLFIIGAGLPHELHKAWREEEPDNEGIAKRVKQGIPIDKSGEPIGYDVVSYSYHDFAHSWLCSGLEKDMSETFGIRVNSIGLLNTYADAKKVNDWIAEDDGKGVRAEPEPYDLWLVVSYPLEA